MENENERLTVSSGGSVEQDLPMHTSVPASLCSTLHVRNLVSQIQGLSSFVGHTGQSKRTDRKDHSPDALLVCY